MTRTQPQLTKLRRILARRYPCEAEQRRVVTEAGLDVGPIAFDASADNSWFNILDHANRVHKLDDLLAYIREENPDSAELAGAVPGGQQAAPAGRNGREGDMANGTVLWDFFLAHAGADMKDAEALYDLLAPGSRVFLDKRSLRPGDEWDLEIARAQRAARVTIVLVSDKYEKAYYLREEIAAAIQLARTAPDAHRVVPVFLDGWPTEASGVPYGLRIRNAIDAKAVGGMAGVAAELRKLAASLAGAPVPAPPAPPVPARYGRTELYDAICRMLPAQVEQLLFYLNLPVAQIAPAVAPLATRAVDVVLLMEQRGTAGLDELAGTIRRVAPGLLE